MAKAIITISDMPDGQIDINLQFEPEGADENSNAHHYAVHLMTIANESNEGGE